MAQNVGGRKNNEFGDWQQIRQFIFRQLFIHLTFSVSSVQCVPARGVK